MYEIIDWEMEIKKKEYLEKYYFLVSSIFCGLHANMPCITLGFPLCHVYVCVYSQMVKKECITFFLWPVYYTWLMPPIPS